MKQYTDKDQTAKLIELGFPRPQSIIDILGIYNEVETAYSIGELIEFLPLELEPHPDMARRTIVGNEVLYCDESIDWVELRFNKHKEIIDNLFDACVTLKEEDKMNKEYKELEVLSARLAESVLMDWDKEEQVRLAKEVATKCHSIFNDKESRESVSLVKRMREAQEELDTCSIGDYAFRQHCAAQLESEVDEYLKRMEE